MRGHFFHFEPDAELRPVTRASLRRVVSIFRPYRRRVTGVAVLILVTSGLGVINPLLIKVAFDDALFVPGGPRMGLLFVVVSLMVAVPVVSGLLGIWQTYLSNIVGQRVMQDLRNSLYAHLQRMHLRFFTSTRTGEIQSRLSNDVGGVQSVVTDTASGVLSNVVVVISTVVAMLLLSWQLTLLSLGTLPFFFWLTQRVGRARREVAAVTQKSMADLSAITEETLSVSGILLSKAFGRQSYETERFRRENERLAGLQIRQQMIGRSFFATIQIFFSITPALVYLVAGFVLQGGGGGLTAGDIVAFTTLQSRLFFPIGQMLQVSVEVQSAMALFERIFEYLDMPHEITDRPGARRLEPAEVRGNVRLHEVWFRYEHPVEDDGRPPVSPTEDGDAERQRRLWTLEGVDMEVPSGQLAALVGPSGAGKTTVTYLIPRFYDVQRGSVEIDGIDVPDITLESLGEIIGMVTQETYLFHSSVRENLLYGNPEATDEQLEAAARAAFIHDRIMELPNGYDTVVGERGYKMSGGEKQRLAIARVVLKDPRILILDEATSSLDTTSERLVQEALRPLMEGRTTIAIAHRLSTILAADVIFVLDRGRVVEQGTHEELLERGGLYAHLYLQQFQGGKVEAETADGVVLSSGRVVPRQAG
ncbi:MAG TPA: ABC transporter ATP-binding protein [Actinomycetota bacterium]|nr:ABC transporter ATP-binding protein [Actinomycetota bacterium]